MKVVKGNQKPGWGNLSGLFLCKESGAVAYSEDDGKKFPDFS
jgi:hypothetical protein